MAKMVVFDVCQSARMGKVWLAVACPSQREVLLEACARPSTCYLVVGIGFRKALLRVGNPTMLDVKLERAIGPRIFVDGSSC